MEKPAKHTATAHLALPLPTVVEVNQYLKILCGLLELSTRELFGSKTAEELTGFKEVMQYTEHLQFLNCALVGQLTRHNIVAQDDILDVCHLCMN